MELEMGCGESAAVEEEMQGWETPTREECRIPVVPPCPAPPRKRAVTPPEVGKERREPPKGSRTLRSPDSAAAFPVTLDDADATSPLSSIKGEVKRKRTSLLRILPSPRADA
ncbi:hypothetical protein GUJ93_ZPchr0013g34746 [Zizania palustris]|uniref:Uncharacterized protein n=1 Tax=Zizania palustris TaxID=103762 RepID=A0A8J5X6Y8_ZIZPA|nr:hypothetical protein GUJ93_ZPchr0013g34746 [Zizania palustris]